MTHTRFILADSKNSVNALNFYFRGTEGWPCDTTTSLLIIVSHFTSVQVLYTTSSTVPVTFSTLILVISTVEIRRRIGIGKRRSERELHRTLVSRSFNSAVHRTRSSYRRRRFS